MAKPKMGLVGLCSHFESGGQRHDELISSAAKAMEAAGIDVVVANRSVWDPVDAMDVCDQFKEAGIEYTIKLIDEYRVCGINGIHLYALNKYDDVARIVKESGIVDLI